MPSEKVEEPPGEFKLISAFLRLAARDVRSKNPQIRGEAASFWLGETGSLDVWCELVGVEPDRLRAKLGVNVRSK